MYGNTIFPKLGNVTFYVFPSMGNTVFPHYVIMLKYGLSIYLINYN